MAADSTEALSELGLKSAVVAVDVAGQTRTPGCSSGRPDSLVQLPIRSGSAAPLARGRSCRARPSPHQSAPSCRFERASAALGEGVGGEAAHGGIRALSAATMMPGVSDRW